MSASAEMPYFIRPSQPLTDAEKATAYTAARQQLDALLEGETDPILKMVTINAVLKSHLPYYYWVGFYLLREGQLTVGPYQGTLGCLHIEPGRGVCGAVAVSRQTLIVDDVHTLQQGVQHIACDPNSRSEMVVPVLDRHGTLIAVFDVDSTLTGSFDVIDQAAVEALLATFFTS